MLVLTRRERETIVLILPGGRKVTIGVVDVRGERVRVGVEADADIAIHRGEMLAEFARAGGGVAAPGGRVA